MAPHRLQEQLEPGQNKAVGVAQWQAAEFRDSNPAGLGMLVKADAPVGDAAAQGHQLYCKIRVPVDDGPETFPYSYADVELFHYFAEYTLLWCFAILHLSAREFPFTALVLSRRTFCYKHLPVLDKYRADNKHAASYEECGPDHETAGRITSPARLLISFLSAAC